MRAARKRRTFIGPIGRSVLHYTALVSTLYNAVAGGCAASRIDHFHSESNAESANRVGQVFDAVRSEAAGLPAKIRANLAAEQSLRATVATSFNDLIDQTDLVIPTGTADWRSLQHELYRQFGLTLDHSQRDLISILQQLPEIQDSSLRDELRKDAVSVLVASVILMDYPAGYNDLVRVPTAILVTEFIDRGLALRPPSGSLSEATRVLLKQRSSWTDLRDVKDRLARAIALPLAEPRRLKRAETPSPRPRIEPTLEEQSEALATLGNHIDRKKHGEDARRVALDKAEAAVGRLMKGDLGARSAALATAIPERIRQLAIVLKTYEVLVKGERARIAASRRAREDATKRAAIAFPPSKPEENAPAPKTTAAKSAQPEPTEEPTSDAKALALFLDLRVAIRDHFRSVATQRKVLAEATDLQRRLVATAEASRDPASVYCLVPLVGDGFGSADEQLLKEYIQALKDKTELLSIPEDPIVTAPDRATDADKPTGEFLAAARELRALLIEYLGKPGAKVPNLSDLLGQAIRASDLLSLDLDILKSETAAKLASELQAPIESFARMLSAGAVDDDGIKVFARLIAGPPSGGTPTALDKFLTPGRISYLRNVLTAIVAEDAAAGKRVVDLLVAMHRLHDSLYEENVRHYLSLTGIVKSEIERWETLHALAGEFESLLARSGPLFQAGDIDPNTPIIHSIRLLAAAAQSRQFADPSQQTTELEAVETAAARLAQAIAVIQGYELISTVNRRRASDNSIALISEIAHHTAQLDHIVSSSTELEIRYRLDQIIAFHSSGITSADIEFVIGTAQAAFLAWIGEKQ